MAVQHIHPDPFLNGLAQALATARANIEAQIEECRQPCFYVSEGRIFEKGIAMPISLEQAREKAAMILDMAMEPAWEDDFTAACMKRLTDLVTAYREATHTPPPVGAAALPVKMEDAA